MDVRASEEQHSVSVPPEQARELPWHVSDRFLSRRRTPDPETAAKTAVEPAAGDDPETPVVRRRRVPTVKQVLELKWLTWRLRRVRNRWRGLKAAGLARRFSLPAELRVDVSLTGGVPPRALARAARKRGTAPVLDLTSLEPRITVTDRELWRGDEWLPMHEPQLLSPAGFPQAADTGTMRIAGVRPYRLRPRWRRELVTAARNHLSVDVTGVPLPPIGQARLILDLAGSGAVVVAKRLDPEVARLVGDELAGLVLDGRLKTLTVPIVRERQSIALRRVVHRQLSVYPGLAALARDAGLDAHDLPTVSVLMSTNRPAMVEFAVDQAARQDYPRMEVLCGLHGFSLDAGTTARLQERLPGLQLHEMSTDLDLGQVLAELGERASGELVSKWDDDDWYASDHLRDLVDALRYSGAGMVGKAAEFVHLTSLGITMRRFAHAAETMSTTVAGGTLMLRGETLREIGGWPAGPKRVDRLLIEALERRDMTTYRTHGFGYLLRRDSHPGSHTWQVEDDYFLRQSVDQRLGLDLAFAGVDQ